MKTTHFTTQQKVASQRGFSLLETLLAVAILMIAIIGPMSLAWASLSSAQDERNESTAMYLAQEAIEYVKNVRDRNTLNESVFNGGTWFASLDSCSTTSPCGVNVLGAQTPEIISCASYNDCLLYVTTNKTYTHTQSQVGGTVASGFTRKVTVTPLQSVGTHDDERLITVTMTWKNHNLNRTLVVTDVMYNYQQ